MIADEFDAFVTPLQRSRARALPWLTVMAGSLATAIPLIATVPLLPPCGLLMLLAWRLLFRFSMRPWAAAPLGLLDDLVSGQPLGSAVLLWSACFLLVDLIDQRLVFRDFWLDWLIATGLIVFCLAAGRFIAVPLEAHVDLAMLMQGVAAVLLFPIATRLVAWVDGKRGYR